MPAAPAKKKTTKRRPPRKKGRPSLLARKRAAILRGISTPIPIKSACLQAGVAPRTVREWIQRGRAELDALALWEAEDPATRSKKPPPVSEFGDFVEAVDVAEAKAEARLVRAVQKKKPLEILKRRFPDTWGDKKRVALEGTDDGPPIRSEGGPPVLVNLVLEDPDDADLWKDATDEDPDADEEGGDE